jgi:imidazolonepropionase
MGGQLKATAISHLEKVSKKGMGAMAMSGTVAVLLPTTAYIMQLRPPPARQFIEAAVPVALGSDFNPNAHCLAMVSQITFRTKNFRETFLTFENFINLKANAHSANLR